MAPRHETVVELVDEDVVAAAHRARWHSARRPGSTCPRRCSDSCGRCMSTVRCNRNQLAEAVHQRIRSAGRSRS